MRVQPPSRVNVQNRSKTQRVPDPASDPPKVRRPGAKKAVNVRIDGNLLEEAKALGVNLSKALEERLSQMLRADREAQWLKENSAAIEAFNRDAEENGIWSDGLRAW